MQKHIVVLTGSGISAESGIATFRGAGGLWEGHSIEEVATPEGFARDPKKVLDFYNRRRRQLADAEPNAAHRALAELEREHRVTIVTQNIDDLHERAGSSRVIHLHGELTKARSSVAPDLVYDIGYEDIEPGQCCEQGSPLRPHVVWFGEEVPMMVPAAEAVAGADEVLVVGTSLQVYPAAGLVELAEPARVPGARVIRKPATRGVPEWVERGVN